MATSTSESNSRMGTLHLIMIKTPFIVVTYSLQLFILFPISNMREESSLNVNSTFAKIYTWMRSLILHVSLEAKVYVLLCVFFWIIL